MKSTFRATTGDDLTAVCAFLRRVFETDADPSFLNPPVMMWKYWHRRDDWAEPRSYVLEKDSAIIAHAGIWPVSYGTGEQSIRGIHMIDWASAKDAPGAGLSLVQKLAAKFDFIYSIGGTEMTQKVLPAFGFVEHSQEWRGARPIRPLRQILTHQTRNWKLAPRLVRNYLWSRRKDWRPGSEWNVEELAPESISSDLLSDLFPNDIGKAMFSPRPPAFFEYLARCPAAKFTLYGISKAGRRQGHFTLAQIRGQARVAGVWLHHPNLENWRAVYGLAQQAAAGIKGVNEITVTGTAGPSAEAAAQSGFRVTPGLPVYLLNKKGKFTAPGNFQFQLSDGDLAFLDTGEAAYWT
jgi:hypothetical protein